MSRWRSWWLAVAFLTRLPTPRLDGMNEDELAAALVWFPWVGALLGGLLVLAMMMAPSQPILAAALLLILWVTLSGNLHLDGLADTLDALAGGHDRQHRLALLKDPCSGPAAVAGVVLLLLLKFAALSVVIEAGAWGALMAVPIIGRTALVGCFLALPYLRPQGLGRAFASYPHRDRLIGSLGMALGIVILAGGWAGVMAVTVAAGAFAGLVRLWRERFGGFSGDLAGATLEVVEAVALLVWAMLI